MNFDDWLSNKYIKIFADFDISDFEKYTNGYNDEKDEDMISYESIELSHDTIKKVIEEYYSFKHKKKMIFSFIKVQILVFNTKIENYLPVVIPQECYRENELFEVEYDVNIFNKNKMNYDQVSNRVPSYIYVLNSEEIKRVFELKGYYEMMISVSQKGKFDGNSSLVIYGMAKEMIIQSHGKVLK